MSDFEVVPMMIPGTIPCKKCGNQGEFFLNHRQRDRTGRMTWFGSARCAECAADEAATRGIEIGAAPTTGEGETNDGL